MIVALMNEFSQASKNPIILKAVESSASRYGVTLYNTAMKADSAEPMLNYIHLSIQAFILLNTKAVDFVITGCGSGQGACMALNSFPGVNCAFVTDAQDAYLFTQINNGNAIAMPFAKDFGWAAELKLEDIFDKIFSCEWGCGYPPKMRSIQQTNGQIFNEVKKNVCKSPVDILKSIDHNIVTTALSTTEFRKCFENHARDSELTDYVRKLLTEGTSQ